MGKKSYKGAQNYLSLYLSIGHFSENRTGPNVVWQKKSMKKKRLTLKMGKVWTEVKKSIEV